MAPMAGSQSLWAPSFVADPLDYDLLRLQHIVIGNAVVMLSTLSKSQVLGNYTELRRLRAAGTTNVTIISYNDAQFVTTPDGVYYRAISVQKMHSRCSVVMKVGITSSGSQQIAMALQVHRRARTRAGPYPGNLTSESLWSTTAPSNTM